MAKHSDLVASTGKKTTRTKARNASVAGDELALTRARLTAEQQGEMTRDLARALALVPGDTAAERDAARKNAHAVDTAARGSAGGWTEVEIPELESHPAWKWKEDGDECIGRLRELSTAMVSDIDGGGKTKRAVLVIEVDGEMRALFLPAFYEPHVRKGLGKVVRIERTGEGRQDTRYTFAYRAK